MSKASGSSWLLPSSSCMSRVISFDHLGHFLGFVLDDPTVILPVAGAGGDILPQPLGVGLDQGDGGLELVGDIGNEGAPRLVLPRFFFHIAG